MMMAFEGLVLSQVGRIEDVQSLVNSEFFAFALPFLLGFAVVYGVLSTVKLPKDKHVRVALGLVVGFLVLPSGPFLVSVLTPLSGGVAVAIGAFLLLIIFFELLGIKSSRKIPVKDERTGQTSEVIERVSVFEGHYKTFLAIIIIVLGLIAINSGVFGVLGIPTPEFLTNAPLVLFLIFIIAVVWWVTARD